MADLKKYETLTRRRRCKPGSAKAPGHGESAQPRPGIGGVAVEHAARKAMARAMLVSVLWGLSASVAHADATRHSAASDAAVCSPDRLKAGRALVAGVTGMYRQRASGPASVGDPSERLRGFNYLGIERADGNSLRVRLFAKQVNGHDCGFDSAAVLCGDRIRLLPDPEERSALERLRKRTPVLRVTAKAVRFEAAPDGTYTVGAPYCGAMGTLNQVFPRSSRQRQIDDAVFHQ